jgi:Protein of unknown function (DUF692)
VTAKSSREAPIARLTFETISASPQPLGAREPLDRAHLARLKRLCDRYQPECFSEHLAWSSHGGLTKRRARSGAACSSKIPQPITRFDLAANLAAFFAGLAIEITNQPFGVPSKSQTNHSGCHCHDPNSSNPCRQAIGTARRDARRRRHFG